MAFNHESGTNAQSNDYSALSPNKINSAQLQLVAGLRFDHFHWFCIVVVRMIKL